MFDFVYLKLKYSVSIFDDDLRVKETQSEGCPTRKKLRFMTAVKIKGNQVKVIFKVKVQHQFMRLKKRIHPTSFLEKVNKNHADAADSPASFSCLLDNCFCLSCSL